MEERSEKRSRERGSRAKRRREVERIKRLRRIEEERSEEWSGVWCGVEVWRG